jgi:CDP-diacylglycerol---serine O-phosphatidyltransferase
MQQKKNRGIYLLPNLFTTASLFAAFYSIIKTFNHRYESAIIAIFVAMIADSLDGRIARLTNTETAFGGEYDSLADMVTCGVAPAILLYSWGLGTLGKLGWLVTFLYTAGTALRLARFNTQIGIADKRYFQGLSSPPAAAVLASFVWLCEENAWKNTITLSIAAILTIFVAVLMVSKIRYYSFKDLDFKGKVPFLYIIIIVVSFIAIAANPSLVLFICFTMYSISGVLQTLLALKNVRKKRIKRSK